MREYPPELLSPREAARADALAIAAGVPVATLMENAGRAVARAARRRFTPCPTVALCGPGNNGGDGHVAARLLAAEGWPVAVARLAAAQAGSDAAEAAGRFRGPVVAFDAELVARTPLVIDGLFGAGLTRDLDGTVIDVLRAARRVLAIDVPSGLDGATGAVRGYAPQAALTVTFFRRKPGHLLLPGRDRCGETLLADIGLPASMLAEVRPRTFANGPALWRLRTPEAGDHKYARGHVTILGGAMTGAARLAAEGARRAGAGMVTIAARAHADAFRAGSPGVIVSEAALAELLADPRRAVWVCGPGLGPDEAASALPALLAAGRQVVADADCFTAFAGRPEALRGCAVLTPHAGEFARVFGPLGTDRLTATRAAAARSDATVLLKGNDTVIAAPNGRAAINASAPPWLATAGAGDVLSGIIAGLLAQGLPGWQAACAGAWLHGEAAQIAGPGLVAEDLPPALPQAVMRATQSHNAAAAL